MSVSLQIHVFMGAQSRLSLVLGWGGSQKALVVLCLCLQSLAHPEQAFVAGLDEGEVLCLLTLGSARRQEPLKHQKLRRHCPLNNFSHGM